MTMKSSDRSILLGLVILGLAAAFWFLVLTPKREEASELDTQIAQVQQELDAQRATVAQAVAARDSYERSYRSLVELGKAVPDDSDTSSMIVQLQELADKAKVNFAGLTLSAGSGGAPAPAAAETTTDQNQESGDAESTPVEAPTMAPPTEATAANLPLGATVGPAGLPVMQYQLDLTGDFFGVADLMASLDKLVHYDGAKLAVNGRLFTVDGFTMAPDDKDTKNPPELVVSVSLTSYIVPASEGLTGGATPTAPAPATTTTTSTTP
jgi:hypothetical protein